MKLLLVLALVVAQAVAQEKSMKDFLFALATVESRCNDDAIGDNGKSIGRYQIQLAYWKDAVEHNKKLREGHAWEDVKDPDYAEKIVEAYLSRYAAKQVKAQDWEYLARIHNGGPSIHRRKNSKAWVNTSAYWSKVKKELDK